MAPFSDNVRNPWHERQRCFVAIDPAQHFVVSFARFLGEKAVWRSLFQPISLVLAIEIEVLFQ